MVKNYFRINTSNLFLIFFLISVFGIAQDEKKTTFNYGGYVKFDLIQTWYNNGEVGATAPIRDFILPSQIPVGNNPATQTLDFHVKESRFNFDVTTEINNQKIHGFLELDFLLSSQGDERVSNSFSPRLRHFYFEWKRLLIGQTWSTFMVVIIPDDLDFAGALEGLIFIRQPQIRYKVGTWMFALENPESLVYSNQTNTQQVSDKEFLPDVVVRKNFGGDWGTWSIAGMYRTLSISDTVGTHRTPGFGITTGGKINVGQRGDDFRLTVSAGSGVGRYQAANFLADAVYESATSLRTLNTLNGYVAYNHFWIPKVLSSSANVGYFQFLDDNLPLAQTTNQTAVSASINLKYDPVPQLRLGVEYSWASRELLNGTNGSLSRVQFSAKYRFGYTDESTIEK
ncbi:MAG: DcaP family trimeric outer membrane transporter [Schleiferiaceae bacterium]|jgi:hypothetical protein|nr:DcaP family trimeric outer membrane transporter [Schleiferiaceae bacterium]